MRNLLVIFSLLLCAPTHLPAAESETEPGEWKLISTEDNVALYRRSRPGPGHYEHKAIGEIKAPTTIVHAVLQDHDAYPSFMPYTIESRVLKKEGDVVIGYQRISSPLVKDRDYTLRVRTTAKQVEGGMQYLSRWETDNAQGPPEKPGVIRVNLCEGGWFLEPVNSGTTRATYTLYTDSGGAIPTFVKNIASQVAFRKIFAALRKQVLDPKYEARKRDS